MPDCELTDLQIYEIIKSHIQHENVLIHNRVTWLLTLQGFLFGGYGFSLTAQATIYESEHHRVPWFIYNARTAMAVMGLLSSLVLLLGSAAAALSIIRFIDEWRSKKPDANRLPQIAGEAVPVLGPYAGLLPTYMIPVSTSVAWVWLVHNTVTWMIFCAVMILTIYGIIFLIPQSRRWPVFGWLYMRSRRLYFRLGLRAQESAPATQVPTTPTDSQAT